MRRIAHVSDLHFGVEDPAAVEALVADVTAVRPDLTIVSGDLTQRARALQFAAARAFLDRLPEPRLVIPGNHDISVLDHVVRVASPRSRYVVRIHHDLDPTHVDDEIAVACVNTSRPLAWKNGRIARHQIARLDAFFRAAGPERMRILVTHHPFVPRPGERRARMTPRALRVTSVLAGHEVDLLLAGHYHQAYAGWFRVGHGKALVLQAGTAASRRTRGEPNSYNVLDVGRETLSVEVRAWNGARFGAARTTGFVRRNGAWHEDGAESAAREEEGA